MMHILLLLVGITAGPRNATVMGTVTDDRDSSAIAGAVVALRDSCTDDSVVTDSLGSYDLTLTPGEYVLVGSHQRYLPGNRWLAVDSGQQLRVDFQLHHKPFAMPTTEITGARVLPRRWPSTNRAHNDSVLGLLRGLRFVGTKPWWWSLRDGEPDSGSIRLNNETVKAAMLAYEHRHRRGLFKRQPSYFLQCDGNYLIICRGQCRLVVDYIGDVSRTVNVFDVDSLRVTPYPLDSRDVAVPEWAALQRYVPLELQAFIRESNVWSTIVSQHVFVRR